MKASPPLRAAVASALLTALLSACSNLKPASALGASSAADAAGKAATTKAPALATPPSGNPGPASAGSPGNVPPPFEQVIKGAQRQEGLLPIWTRQDKVWIELQAKDFGKPLFLSPKLATGIGEAGVFGGLMQSRWAQVGKPQWVEFRKVHQQVQWLAVNASYTAQAGSPQARAVAAAFSPSLLGSTPMASAPHAQSGAVLIEANAVLLSDLLGLAQHLQRSYRQSYALDPRNSTVLRATARSDQLVFEVAQHYATAGIAAGGGAPGVPTSTVPMSVPDPRSLFVTVHLSLTALPDKPMARRAADARVGYFHSTVADFSDELARTPRQRFINRWRLEKKDPAAAMSEPIQPIVYWLDPSIPDAYRGAITEGVLAWNKAFEAIGFRQAIEVRTPPTDRAFDTLDTGHASIRWMTNSQPAFGALGPTHVDPRTGEILDADIALESLSSRAIRTVRSQVMGSEGVELQAAQGHAQCQHGAHAAEQLGLALEVLQAQGVLAPDSPQVQAFVLAYLKDTTMHEVGHALGLRHNFRGSRWRTAQELGDAALTQAQGHSASVMDYAPINLPAPGQPAGAPFQTTLGPYDYWAIEYGYKPLPDEPAAQQAALQAIARRSAEPEQALALAYGTDEDNLIGLDPHALTFDLGRDPVAFARTRLAIIGDLLQRQATRALGPQDDRTLLRRSVVYGLRDMARTGQILLRQVGGVLTLREAPGPSQALLDPLPAAQQREALKLLTSAFLSPQALALPAALQRRLAPDYLDRQEGADASPGSTDFSVAEQALALQRGVLASLMADTLAERLLDNIDKTRDREPQPLTVRELHRHLYEAVWQAQSNPPEADSRQRNLQREHVNRLAAALVRGGSGRADVRALVRQQARLVLQHLQRQAQGEPRSTAAAHRQDCIDTLSSALQASVLRAAP